MGWLKRWRDQRTLSRRPIPDALWQSTLERFGFLQWRSAADLLRLRELTTLFLADKEFTGAHGLKVDDRMAVAIAAQACLLIIRLDLEWFADFKGIVVQPDVVLARRESVDEAGVVHAFDEELSGEAMQGGPVMLAWHDVAEAGRTAGDGYNVVVHEFAHVMDLRQGAANGIPPLPNDRLRRHWVQTLDAAHARFCRQIERGQQTLLDRMPQLRPRSSSLWRARRSSSRRSTCNSTIRQCTNCFRGFLAKILRLAWRPDLAMQRPASEFRDPPDTTLPCAGFHIAQHCTAAEAM